MAQPRVTPKHRVAASPRARRAMRLAGVDPAGVRGTGPGGRIVAADVVQGGSQPTIGDSPNAAAFCAGLSAMRRAVARATTASAAIPQFQLHAELDARPMIEARSLLLSHVQGSGGARLSFTDMLLCAMGAARRRQPTRQCDLARRDHREIDPSQRGPGGQPGRWTAAPDHHGHRSAKDRRVGSASRRSSRDRPLGPPDFGQCPRCDELEQPGHNTGGQLCRGRISAAEHDPGHRPDRRAPWAAGGNLEAAATLRLTLSVDHRVLDGAPAAQFLGRIVHYLEEPEKLLEGRVAHKA